MFTTNKMPYYAYNMRTHPKERFTKEVDIRNGKYNMQKRENALKEWLIETIKYQDFILTPLVGDASFRRYYRVNYQGVSQIVMDAPLHQENLKPFIDVAKILDKAQVPTPQILAINEKQGFLLLTDLGDELLLNHLNPKTADHFYEQAMNTLFRMQHCSNSGLPSFDSLFMLQEMNLCYEWFFNQYLALNLNKEDSLLSQETFRWIAAEITQHPLSFIHRDYHSRNLMLRKETRDVAVIDFQDAMQGSIAYDLVSLLKDCYISWPREQVLKWISFFYAQNKMAQELTFSEFTRAFDLCGLQRHLKVLGIFCRLHLRDQKPNYLKHLPLILKYVLECCELYPELHSFFDFFQNRVRLP